MTHGANPIMNSSCSIAVSLRIPRHRLYELQIRRGWLVEHCGTDGRTDAFDARREIPENSGQHLRTVNNAILSVFTPLTIFPVTRKRGSFLSAEAERTETGKPIILVEESNKLRHDRTVIAAIPDLRNRVTISGRRYTSCYNCNSDLKSVVDLPYDKAAGILVWSQIHSRFSYKLTLRLIEPRF